MSAATGKRAPKGDGVSATVSTATANRVPKGDGASPTRPPLLVLAVGNPSRGDDALGPLFVERAGELFAERIARGELELLTDFQLQVEHALDLQGRARVFFVDASVAEPPPFGCTRIQPARDASFSSHALSPAAVLDAYVKVVGEPLPESWVLAIRGERFELGEPLGRAASDHLDAALRFFGEELARSGR